MAVRRYITTAIDYPNAPPHMGHVLEKVLADAIARWWRLHGDDVRFQIGTDEHGVKIQQTADREGVIPQVLVDRNVPLFRSLYDRLDISYDHFIRTSDRAAHWPTVRELWKRLRKDGALEKRTYKGLYCSGCERFVTKKDLVDGKCPDHGKAPEEVREENWFFLLKREGEWLRDLLTRKDGYRIIPASRSRETISLLDQGLEDVSFSRPKSSLSWGIPVPDDEGQTMYVWCDALTNYISGLGYFQPCTCPYGPEGVACHERGTQCRVEWWEGADVTHVIGKDIARFHALIWPAMLKHAGVRPPDRLLVHGFITSEGQKMSKSIGNVVNPAEVIAKYGVDALRFYLLREIPVGNDGDFSWEHFDSVYSGVLQHQIGNLLNRVVVLLCKDGQAFHLPGASQEEQKIGMQWEEFSRHMDAFEVHRGAEDATDLARFLNLAMQERQPWRLKGDERTDVLSLFAESLRHLALFLLPFIPETAREISAQLGVPYADRMPEKSFVVTEEMKRWGGCTDWKRVGEPKILFPKVD